MGVHVGSQSHCNSQGKSDIVGVACVSGSIVGCNSTDQRLHRQSFVQAASLCQQHRESVVPHAASIT